MLFDIDPELLNHLRAGHRAFAYDRGEFIAHAHGLHKCGICFSHVFIVLIDGHRDYTLYKGGRRGGGGNLTNEKSMGGSMGK